MLNVLNTPVTVCIYLHMLRNSRKIIARLKREGWQLRSVSGSHHQFEKGSRRLTVPHPKKDLPVGTARQIAKQAGWTEAPDTDRRGKP